MWMPAGCMLGAWCIAGMKMPTITELALVGGAARRSSFRRDRAVAHSLRNPICVGADDANPASVLIHEGMCREVVVYHNHIEISRRRPLQSTTYIRRPDAPPRAVFELDGIGLLMRFDQHDVPSAGARLLPQHISRRAGGLTDAGTRPAHQAAYAARA